MKIDLSTPASLPVVAPSPRDRAVLPLKSGVRAGTRERLVERLVEYTPNEPIC